MGTYALTIVDIPDRTSEIGSLEQAVENTYMTNNEYRHQELVHFDTRDSDKGIFVQRIGSVLWNEKTQESWYLSWTGGGSAAELATLQKGESEWKYIKAESAAQVITPSSWVYSPKHEKYYGAGAGLAEYTDDDLSYTQRGVYTLGQQITYDSKRGLVISVGDLPAPFSTGTKNLVSIDPSGPDVDDPVFGAPYKLLDVVSLYDTGALLAMNHLAYSEYNDVIYWTITASDDADIDDMIGADQIMIKVLHEAASGPSCQTDAVFTCVIIEYV